MTNQSLPDQPPNSEEREATQKQIAPPLPRRSERFDAFLSHNSKDKQDVEKIREKLEAAGINVWIDRNELSGGDSLPMTLKRALHNSAACVVFIGAHGVGRWQEKEIAAADKLKRPKRRMIPVFLPGSVGELPASLKERELLWIEFRDSEDQLALAKLIKDILTKVKDQSRWDRIRRVLITGGVIIPLMAIAWATREFCTFQAEFAPLIENQRQEIVIARRFDPLPQGWRFRQGTWIMRDACRDQSAEDKINGRVKLNVGLMPDWMPLVTLVDDAQHGLAELEWFEHPDFDSAKLLTVQTEVEHGEAPVPPDQQPYKIDIVGWGRVVPHPVIDVLVAKIKDHSEHSPRAMRALLELGKSNASVIDAFIPLLKDSDSGVRSFAAESLGLIAKSNANVIDSLIPLLKDPDSYVRISAALALGQQGNCDAKVIGILVALLKQPEHYVRSRTARALAQLGKRDAIVINSLVALLEDRNHDVSFNAASALIQLGQSDVKVVDALVKLIPQYPGLGVDDRAVDVLFQLGKSDAKVVDALAKSLEDPNIEVLYYAAETLAKLGKSDAIVMDTLVALLKSKNSRVRAGAASRLGKLGKSDANVIDALVPLLKDSDIDIQRVAATSLAQLGKSNADVIGVLTAALKHDNIFVRKQVAESLVQLGKIDANVIQELVKLLHDNSDYAPVHAATCLVQLGKADANVIDTLVTSLRNPRKDVSDLAAASLVQLAKSDANVIEALLPALKDPDSNFRSCAAVALVQMGRNDSNLIEVLVALLTNVSGYWGSVGGIRDRAGASLVQLGKSDTRVIAAFVSLLSNGDNDIRLVSAVSLIQLGKCDANVIETLVELLKDRDRNLRTSAAEALGQQTNSDANVIAALNALLKDQDSNVRDISEKAIGNLAQGRSEWTDKQMLADLADNDSSVRERAGIVLAYRWQRVDSELTSQDAERLKDIRDQVEKLRTDSRPWVKQASLHALYRIEKRKAELEDEARKKAEQKTAPTE